MAKRISYTDASANIDESLDDATVVSDFLPSPEELVRKVGKEKITIAIDKQSLDLFKSYAMMHDSKYQTMINGVLSAYAEKYLSGKK